MALIIEDGTLIFIEENNDTNDIPENKEENNDNNDTQYNLDYGIDN